MIPVKTKRRRGFTIVELVAVAGCLSVLSSLLIPALQDARSAANRTRCQNNLKYIGLSLHNYHDVYNTFPLGWVTRYRDGESSAGFGWQTMILPYMEQAPLYQQLNVTDPMTEPEGVLTGSVSTLVCPEDADMPKTNPFRGGYGTSSYSGSMGTIAPPRWADGRMESFWPGAVPTFALGQSQAPDSKSTQPTMAEAMVWQPNGLFSWNARIGFRDMTDGTSNTIGVSERSRISGWSIWPGVGSNRFENDALTDVSFQSPLNKSLTGFSSAHAGGLLVLICDGSVRFMSNDIDSKPEGGVLQHLATRSGGEVISGDPLLP